MRLTSAVIGVGLVLGFAAAGLAGCGSTTDPDPSGAADAAATAQPDASVVPGGDASAEALPDAATSTADAGQTPDAAEPAGSDAGALPDSGQPGADAGTPDDGGQQSAVGIPDVCRDSAVLSPDAKLLVFVGCGGATDGNVFVYDVASGTHAKISDYPGEKFAFTPGNARIVFDQYGVIRSYRADGTAEARISPDTEYPGWFIVNPADGTVIWASNRKKILVSNADGSGSPREIVDISATSETLSLDKPVLTPDGTRLIFWYGSSSLQERFIVPVDGSAPAVQLGSKKLEPAWNSLTDTHLVARTMSSTGAFTVEDIALADGSATVLATGVSAFVGIKFAADSVFFAKSFNDIWRVQRGSTDAPVQVSSAGGGGYLAAPDGSRVIYSDGTNLVSKAADGSGSPVEIMTGVGAGGMQVRFSPDASKIAAINDAAGGGFGTKIADVAAAGSEQVLRAAGVAKVGDSLGFNATGSHVVYLVGETSALSYGVEAAPVDGGAPVPLGTAAWMTWRPIPGTGKVFLYDDIEGTEDLSGTLKIVAP